MQSSMDRKARRLRELRDDGAISDEDYRSMVLDLVDAEGDRPVTSPEPVTAKEAAPAPSPVEPQGKGESPEPSPMANVPEPPKAHAGGVSSEDAVPDGATGPESEGSSLPDTQGGEAKNEESAKVGRLGRLTKRGKALIAVVAVALVALAAVGYGFWTGDIALKPNDISQEYWDAGRRARAIGRDYLGGKVTAQEAKAELEKVSVSDEPWNATGNPALPLKEVLNDQYVYRAINELKGSIDRSARTERLNQSVSDDRVRDAMHSLEQALSL